MRATHVSIDVTSLAIGTPAVIKEYRRNNSRTIRAVRRTDAQEWVWLAIWLAFIGPKGERAPADQLHVRAEDFNRHHGAARFFKRLTKLAPLQLSDLTTHESFVHTGRGLVTLDSAWCATRKEREVVRERCWNAQGIDFRNGVAVGNDTCRSRCSKENHRLKRLIISRSIYRRFRAQWKILATKSV